MLGRRELDRLAPRPERWRGPIGGAGAPGDLERAAHLTGQRTNDIVRVLTVVSAVLLPAVVIAGIMGMNFKPGFFDEPVYFFVVVAAMIGLAVATLVLARLKGWI